MSGIGNVCYGLYQGDRLTVISQKGRKIATVVKEYPYHILMDFGGYQRSVNKSDIYTGDVKIERRQR